MAAEPLGHPLAAGFNVAVSVEAEVGDLDIVSLHPAPLGCRSPRGLGSAASPRARVQAQDSLGPMEAASRGVGMPSRRRCGSYKVPTSSRTAVSRGVVTGPSTTLLRDRPGWS